MGKDLELADCAAARYQVVACQEAASLCEHDPDCEAQLYRLLARAAAARPGKQDPSEFVYRRFADIIETMQQLGMGFAATAEPYPGKDADGTADLRWRSQTVPGKAGIPAFKLSSNDRWLITVREIDEALAAYAGSPAEVRAELETDPKWAAWLEWLAVARDHGGFEVE